MKKILSLIVLGGGVILSLSVSAQGVWPTFSYSTLPDIQSQLSESFSTKMITDQIESAAVDQLLGFGEKGWADGGAPIATSAQDALVVDLFPKITSEETGLTPDVYKEPAKAVAVVQENVMMPTDEVAKTMTTAEKQKAAEVIVGLQSDAAKAGVASGLAQMKISEEQPKRVEALQKNFDESSHLRGDVQARSKARLAAAAEESRLLSIEAQMLGVEAASALSDAKSGKRKSGVFDEGDSSKVGA